MISNRTNKGLQGHDRLVKQSRPCPQTTEKQNALKIAVNMSGIKSRVILLLAAALLFVLAAGGTIRAEEQVNGRNHRVLLLNSYHAGYPWSDDITSGVRKTLMSEIPDVDIRIEYMDTKKHPPEDVFPTQAKLYSLKYADSQPSVIVCSDNNALQFLLQHRNSLFPGVPIVFCGINNFDDSMLSGHKGITGIVEAASFHSTVKLALRLHPQAKAIYSVAGSAVTSRIHIRTMAEVAREFNGKIDFIELHKLTVNQLASSLRKIPKDSIVFHLGFHRDAAGKPVSVPEAASIIQENTTCPTYSMWDQYLPGCVGGVMICGHEQGKQAAIMAAKIIRGQSADTIPVIRKSPNVTTLNYDDLVRCNVDLGLVPHDAVIINEPKSMYYQYRIFIWWIIGLFCFMCLSIVILGANIIRRKAAEEAQRESEERMELALRGADLGTWDWNIQTDDVTFNERWAEMLGYTLDEVDPKLSTWEKLAHPDDMPGVQKALNACLEGKTAFYETEHRMRHKSNRWVWILDKGCVIEHDAAGNPLRACGTHLDITNRKQAEEAVREKEWFHEAILNDMITFVAMLDPSGNLIFINNTPLKVGGIKLEDVRGKKFFDTFWWTHSDKAREILKRDIKLCASGESLLHDVQIQTADGSLMWIEYSMHPIRDKHGVVQYLIPEGRNITDRKRAEEEKLALERQVQHAQKLESLGVLAGGIAHDFNNLLMAILGNADLALDELSPHAPARENIKEIEKASKRAAELARQMLAYSGRGRFVIEPIALNEFVEEMTHLLEVSISKRVMLKYNFADNLPTFDGDASQIRQIIMNLIINASESIGDKSGVIALSTGAMDCDRVYINSVNEILRAGLDEPLPEGIYSYLEVADTGCGMDKATIEKIFDPFFTTKFTGRGLGMSAVLGIVRGHKGAIKIYSEAGKGSTFKILFPANELPENGAATRKKDESTAKDWHRKGTILIADDEETVCAVGKQMLERMGFDVLLAPDGREALKVFREHTDEIICVLLDLTMPHMNGEETFREMRRVRSDATVILCSGYNMQDATQRFSGKGLAGFLQKPYNMAALKEKLMEVLPQKQSD